ncbi:Molybdopterin synthase catalytic subunit [Coemansia sp. RSA 1290]|nr:Molybdopterin synthase catalytic subunit [Coemansia sp. RSA 1086]KAJ1747147.1 Molybdopterin synthase catalytic subunit [Coemansia sp. RSA 1821]KAJ1869186.1 Molybdopterin synthase catalytic subunit [Coemansia sp. RSA 990]KAJ2630528.1 Molybdopterin synthase catalytic subunit [Coemansia sp. RSA 1290]KAJ2645931.1 Molybdopterin synthase catalytic subunit [Coemansia sp. RSA 1250]KAJ2667745.1 Molybdopterin synthase catalytic subunit [Coemansia sp. RSA 1085]
MEKHSCCNHQLPHDYIPQHHKDASEEHDHFMISPDKLSLDKACDLVRNNAAGAISTFEGTTRDTFDGKQVVKLEYEAYESLAKKEWLKIVQEARSKYYILETVMHHRTGEVGVGQTSVIIAVSSAHRADAINAVHFLIDSLKVRLPIWKKELLDDGTGTWKENGPVDMSIHKSH